MLPSEGSRTVAKKTFLWAPRGRGARPWQHWIRGGQRGQYPFFFLALEGHTSPDNTAGTVLLVQAAAAAGRGMGLGAGAKGWGLRPQPEATAVVGL